MYNIFIFLPHPEVTLFSLSQISDKVLLRILRHPDVIQEIKFNDSDECCPQHYVYQRGKAVDYFILILQVRPLNGRLFVLSLFFSLNSFITSTNKFNKQLTG